jgi:predicted nucleic acid-binding protein
MIVVADSSPLVVLTNLDNIAILPRLFGSVLIPPEVLHELADAKRPVAVQSLAASPPPWLLIRSPGRVEPIERLHSGEQAAISLATELGANLILIDEQLGRKAAVQRHLPVIGTVGLLERAASEGWLNLRETFARLRATDFWVAPQLLEQRLALFEQLQREQSNRPRERER